MGEVYRASDTKLRRQVALKVLPPMFARDAERMARFQQEAHVLASLNHPHIAHIFGLEEADGVHALVLELVEGPTLGDRIRGGRIPIEETLAIALQIAEAVEWAHEAGVIHRDLKPENVKLTADGQVKVLDFGLAKAIESGVADVNVTQSPTISPAITGAMTAANVILGTAGYMSPEQARGQAVDKRADIWSFGVVLYEMLVGRTLFTGDTVSDTLAAVLRVDPDWSALPADTPRRVRRLLRACLERDAKKRLRDMGDARILLEQVLAGEPDEVELAVAEAREKLGAGAVTGATGSGGRGRRIAGLAIAALIAGVVGYGAAARQRPPAAELPLLKFQLPIEDLVTSLGNGGTTAAISPDGHRIAYSSGGQLWIRDLRELEPRRLPGTEQGTVPFWSPDGEWIGYGDSKHLYKIRVAGGAPVTLCELATAFNPAAGGAWRSDGRIVFTDGSSPLLSVSAQGGDPDTLVPLVEGEDDDFHNVSILPDGMSVVFVVHRREGGFDQIDLFADGTRRRLLRMEGQSLKFPAWSPSGHLVFNRHPTNPGVWAVPFSMDALALEGEPFLAFPEASLPSVSRTGTMVLALGDFSKSNRMAWVDRAGRLEGPVGVAQDQDTFYALSPDGGRIALRAFNEDPEVWIVDVTRGTQTRLTFSDGSESWPTWSPDGRRIYYQDSRGFPDTDLWMMAADGAGEPVELGKGGWCDVSPDGRTLAYCLHMGSNDWDLYSLALGDDGLPAGEPELFLDTSTIAWAPVFSPDGRYLAYHSQESDRNEIYLKTFPAGPGKWQVSVNGGWWPHWNADGTELFFVEGDSVMAVSVDLGPPVRLGTPQLLFRRPEPLGALPFGWPDAFEVTPDGERFLIATRPEDAGPDAERGLVVVQNWFREFGGAAQ